MIRAPVLSSRMKSVGWKDNVMEIEFNDGAIYQYYDVSKSYYIDFINSPSLGSALHRFDKIHSYKIIF